jgi:hypothetical protein
MNTTQDRIKANISGTNYGMVIIGNSNTQVHNQQVITAPSEEDRASLNQLLAGLRQRVAQEVPTEKQAPALERVGELEEALSVSEPDLSTMEYVKKWFERHLPDLAGAVTGIIMNPIVGKLVGAAGDILALEFRRRFGT